MKILVLIGSPRKGNTYNLTKCVKEELNKNKDVEFEDINLSKLELGFCSSCHNCILKDEKMCKDRNVISSLEEKMLSSDGIIISTPVYMLNVPACVKNYIDHFAYMLHRPTLQGKFVMVISNTAGDGDKKVANYLKEVFTYWGCNKVFILTHKLFSLNLNITDKLRNKVKKITYKFYNNIKINKHYDPSWGMITLFSVFRAMNFIDTKESADKIYYKKMGWFEKPYHSKLKNPLKKLYGNTMFLFMKKILSKNF